MKHSNWLVMAIMAAAVIFAAFTVWPQNDAPPTVVETRYVPSDSISQDAFEEQRYRADIAEIKMATLEAQRDWYAIIMAVLGILVTVVILIFGFRFGRQAVQEAKLEARNISLNAVKEKTNDLEKLLERGSREIGLIESFRNKIDITYLLDDIDDSNVRSIITELSNVASKKQIHTLTREEFTAIVQADRINKKWNSMLENSKIMFESFNDTESNKEICFALYSWSYSLYMLKKYDNALDKLEEIKDRFEDNEENSVREIFSKSINNKTVCLLEEKRFNEAMNNTNYSYFKFKNSKNDYIKGRSIIATYNRAVCAGMVGEEYRIDNLYQHSIDIYNKIIKKYSNYRALYKIQYTIELSWFNMACMYAKLQDVDNCIKSLKGMFMVAGKIDCKMIAGDKDFDNVRTSPAFQKFLRKHNCQS